ncbi:tetratricopeptide repeat protein 19 homolog, mitochondrial isoform X1 [Drosophila takahashii]|uniref:tetratricopeptide repeat protein 19 homolog, mitochondrial isoform X1 n=1 Tax=Drosophila takahashii TaxID=29030 RepID=UPI001CF81C3A|nr:tetratricopeptide repeat protein 19 homolog, mitochondrial [Drosophila takahashii]
MIVKNIVKLTQVMGRLRLVPNPREYSHLAPLRRISQRQRSGLGSRPLCTYAGGHQVSWTTPPAPSSSGGMFWAFSAAFTFNLFGGGDEKEETPEDKLVKTIKRSILCIQREQYDKAEQMLHLALRMAQDIQSKDGITYVFDLMANLAMEREQFKKAEKIFTDVMKRLFADGHTEESPKILHISSKIAHMSQLQGDLEKSFQGFTWTLKQLAKLLEKMPDDKDILELYGLTKNWFGQLLMKQGKYLEARNLFKEAFDTLIDVYGAVNEASVTILNNISVAYVNLEKYPEARETLEQAMELAKELKDATQEGILQANLGLVYLREGLMAQAENACRLAWKLGKQHQNPDAIEQAEYCLNEIKATLNGEKRP